MKAMKRYIQIGYVSVLFSIFVFRFCIPNVQEYLKDESIVLTSTEILSEPIEAPSITICPMTADKNNGWKKDYRTVDYTNFSYFYEVCRDAEDMNDCALEETFNLEETIHYIFLAGNSFQMSNSSEHFSSDITCAACGYGQCHTLKENTSIMTYGEARYGALMFGMNISLNYDIFFHDAKLFYLSMNPGTTPGFRLNLLQGEAQTRVLSIKAIKHIKRDTVRSPCESKANYSFTDCIRY